MIEPQVPEVADGGYWYTVEAVTEDGKSVPDYFSASCQQYAEIDGTVYAVVRVIAPLTVPPCAVTPAQVIEVAEANGSLPAAEKFEARIGGL